MGRGAEAKGSRKIGNLSMIWGFAIRYPGRIAGAAAALLVAASAGGPILHSAPP